MEEIKIIDNKIHYIGWKTRENLSLNINNEKVSLCCSLESYSNGDEEWEEDNVCYINLDKNSIKKLYDELGKLLNK
jgi:hypothetical protein